MPQFRYAESFSDDLAVVGDGDNKYWYINTKGERSFDGEFALASRFFKGLAHVKVVSNGNEEFAYIDTTGRVIFRY